MEVSLGESLTCGLKPSDPKRGGVMRGEERATKQLIAAGKEEGNYLARASMQRSVKALFSFCTNQKIWIG